ncbi:hypothetical protein KKA95_00305 [Patescibacteria group bacterium]|nr:hypothetical protein [Patescibacteria group bacterium]
MPTPEVPQSGKLDETKKDLRNLMSDVQEGIGKLKENPEAVKGAAVLGAIAALAYMFKPEEREKFEEETKDEIESLKPSMPPEEVEAVEQYYEAVEGNSDPEIEIEEPPVITTTRMRAVNIRAINPGNRKKLAGYKKITNGEGEKVWVIDESIKPEDRIILQNVIYKIGSYDVLKQDHLNTFDTFKNHVIGIFQPEEIGKPEGERDSLEQRINKTAKALSYCAIGVYQILPVHHFAKMGWSAEGEEGLLNMYEFITSEEKQKELNLKILEVATRNLGGDIDAIAANYYSGQGKKMLAYKRSGITEKPEWLTKKSPYGYGSIDFYTTMVHKYFKQYYGKDVERINANDSEQIAALQKAIQRKETG